MGEYRDNSEIDPGSGRGIPGVAHKDDLDLISVASGLEDSKTAPAV